MKRLQSRKLWVGIMAPLIIIIAKAIGIDLDDKEVVAIAGIVSAYLLGQAYQDAKK